MSRVNSTFLTATILLMSLNGAAARRAVTDSSMMMTVGDHRIAFHVIQGRAPILVLDAGSGLDSSYWQDILPGFAKRTGSEIITYDRAGWGSSDEVKPPFRMRDAVTDLEAGLKQLGATHELILLPHSFAGEIATYLAMDHPDWVEGAVLVDTNVPKFYTETQVQRQYIEAKSQTAAFLATHADDKQARSISALLASVVAVNRDFSRAIWPPIIQCVVIVSDRTPFALQTDAEHWRHAHAECAGAAANWTLVIARGSSHDVVHDQPDVIIQAVGGMVDHLRQ